MPYDVDTTCLNCGKDTVEYCNSVNDDFCNSCGEWQKAIYYGCKRNNKPYPKDVLNILNLKGIENMIKIKAVQTGKTALRYYMVSMLFLIIGTVLGSILAYQIVKPTITEVSNQCILALQQKYSK